MSLKYNCPLCGFEMITEFLKRGDIYKCFSCGNMVAVPEGATFTYEEPNIRKNIINPYSNEYKYGEDPALVPGNTPFITEDEFPPVEKVKKERPKEWGIFAVVIFLGLYLLSDYLVIWPFMFLYAIFDNIFLSSGPFNNNLFVLSGRIFHQIFVIGILYLIIVKFYRNNFFESLNIHKVSLKTIGKYAILTFGLYIGILVCAGAIKYLLLLSPLKNFLASFQMPENSMGKDATLLILGAVPALMASFSEEAVFRGYIYVGLKRKLGSIVSIIIVSILFVFMHADQVGYSPIHLISYSFGAIILGIIRLRTNSLSKCMLFHFFINFFFDFHRMAVLLWGSG